MSFNISYNVGSEVIRKLELISKTDGYLQVLRMNPDWSALLEKRARLNEAVSSIGIEGTVITLEQAKAITIGEKTVKVGEKEKREFLGYYESLSYIKEEINSSLTVGLLLKIHEKITQGDEKASPGKIRGDLRAVSQDDEIIYKAPPPDHLPFLLEGFVKWFNGVAEDKEFSPIIAASICHFWFVWIHPFCDGNGRVGRLLTTFLLLKKKSEGVRYFALSDYYNRDKRGYYSALRQTNICDPAVPSMNFDNDLSPWISYFVNSYLMQMEDIKEVTNRILQLNIKIEHLRRDGLILETHNKVLSFLSSREKASYGELVDHLGVTKPRVNQILKPLRSAHILSERKIGRTVWFMLGAPEDETDETQLIKVKLKQRMPRKHGVAKDKAVIQKTLPIFE